MLDDKMPVEGRRPSIDHLESGDRELKEHGLDESNV